MSKVDPPPENPVADGVPAPSAPVPAGPAEAAGAGALAAEAAPEATALTTAAAALAAAEAAPAPAGGVRRAALSGAAWILIGFAAIYVVRLVSSVILTRFIDKHIYGMMDLVMAFIMGLYMFSDVGFATCIVQSPRGDEPDFLNTAWTMQILRGVILWFCTALLAKPVAYFYGQPILALVMPLVGVTALIESFDSTAIPVLSRRLLRGRIVLLDLTRAVANLVITVGWVYLAFPELFMQVVKKELESLPKEDSLIWAVVAGAGGANLVFTLLSHGILPGHRNRLRWERPAVSELLEFGKWIFVGTMFTYLAFQTAPLIVPALMDFGTAGLYGRADNLAKIGTGLMSQLAAQLVFPVYSRLHQMGRDIRLAFVQVHTSAAAFAGLLATGMLCCGPTAVEILYPVEWHEAGWILQFLAVGAWFQMLEGTVGASLLAVGKIVSLTIINASKFFGILFLVPLGFWIGSLSGHGFIGMIIGFVASDFLRYLMVVVIGRMNGMSAWPYDLGFSFLIAGFSYVATVAGIALAAGVLGQPPQTRYQLLLQFTLQGVSAVLLWGLVIVGMYLTGNLKLRGIGMRDDPPSG